MLLEGFKRTIAHGLLLLCNIGNKLPVPPAISKFDHANFIGLERRFLFLAQTTYFTQFLYIFDTRRNWPILLLA
jgi:hypothetical protein